MVSNFTQVGIWQKKFSNCPMEQIEIHKRYQMGIKTNPQNGATNQQDDKFMKRMVLPPGIEPGSAA
jgi:hypothetical protein